MLAIGDAGGDVSYDLRFADIGRTGDDGQLAACDAPFPNPIDRNWSNISRADND